MSLNDLAYDRVINSFLETGSATNATATATKAASDDHHHVLRTIVASFSATPAVAALCQVKYGTTVVMEVYVSAPVVIYLGEGHMNTTENQAVSAELGAGGVAVLGKINISGFTTGIRL